MSKRMCRYLVKYMGERLASGSWVWVRDWRRRKRFRPYFNLSGDVKESIYFPISHPSNERTKRSETISSSLRDGKMLFRKNFFVLGGREMVPKIKFIFYRCVGSRWLKYIFQCWAIFNNNNLLDWQKMLSIIAKN